MRSDAGGLPGDKRAHAHAHEVTSDVRAQQQMRNLADHVNQLHSALVTQTDHSHAMEQRFEQRLALLEEAGSLAALHQPTPRPALAVPAVAKFTVAVPVSRFTSASNPPTPVAPAMLARYSSSGNLNAPSASPRLRPSTGVTAPVLMPAAEKPPSAAEEAASSDQPSGGFTPYLGPMRVPPPAAHKPGVLAGPGAAQPAIARPVTRPFFFGAGEAPWSPTVQPQIPGMCGLQYMMPQQQQIAMQMQKMQQMSQMRIQPGPMQTSPFLPAGGQAHFCQPLMGQSPHMHMGQQQCMMPMPPMMYCSPQMSGQPLPPAGGSLGVSPAADPPNPLKRMDR